MSSPELTTDSSIVVVNRSQSLIYPDWVFKPLHPRLEAKGSRSFDIFQLRHWFHPKQVTRDVKGLVIYKHLKDNRLLSECVGLHELLAIQAKGLPFFRQYLGRLLVYGWKGVVWNNNFGLYVPYLSGDNNEVVLGWDWSESVWSKRASTLHFSDW